MKTKLFFCVLLWGIFAFPVFAAQKFSRELPTIYDSDSANKPEMIVLIDEGKPKYIHSNKKFDCSGTSNHAGGCTRVVFYATINGLILTQDGKIKTVKLQIGLKNIEIEISSELQKGSCLFDAVLKHELTHLALHRKILNRYAPEIAKAVLAVVENFSIPLTQGQVNKIDRVLNDFVNRMMNDDKKQNNLMDTREAYLHLQNQCGE